MDFNGFWLETIFKGLKHTKHVLSYIKYLSYFVENAQTNSQKIECDENEMPHQGFCMNFEYSDVN